MSEEKLQFGEEFEQKEFEALEPGDYEVTLEKVERKVAAGADGTNKKYLNLSLRVRRDIDQPGKGRMLFTKIWANDGDAVYNHSKINHIIVTQKNTGEHYKTDFRTFDDVLFYLHGLNFVVSVEKFWNDYANPPKYDNKVTDWSYKPSSKPFIAVQEEKPSSQNLDSITIDDNDIPF